MAEQTFKPGDVVQLNSGGPAMTVVDANERSVNCLWFDSSLELKQQSIRPAVLKTAELKAAERSRR